MTINLKLVDVLVPSGNVATFQRTPWSPGDIPWPILCAIQWNWSGGTSNFEHNQKVESLSCQMSSTWQGSKRLISGCLDLSCLSGVKSCQFQREMSLYGAWYKHYAARMLWEHYILDLKWHNIGFRKQLYKVITTTIATCRLEYWTGSRRWGSWGHVTGHLTMGTTTSILREFGNRSGQIKAGRKG